MSLWNSLGFTSLHYFLLCLLQVATQVEWINPLPFFLFFFIYMYMDTPKSLKIQDIETLWIQH